MLKFLHSTCGSNVDVIQKLRWGHDMAVVANIGTRSAFRGQYTEDTMFGVQ